MLHMRTLSAAMDCIRLMDPGTALTSFRLRKLVLDGTLPHHKIGNRYLVSIESIESYLANPPEEVAEEEPRAGILRKVRE